MIYLDNAATTRVDPLVFEAMTPFLTEEYGNPGSLHALGRRAKDAVAKARAQVAALINAEPEQIIFTSSGSEANAMALTCLSEHPAFHEENCVLTTAIEHDSVLRSINQIYAPDNIIEVPISRGVDGTLTYKAPELEDVQYVGLISVMLSNNEVPIDGRHFLHDMFEMLKERNNAIIFADAVQALGHTKIDVKTTHKMYDLMSFSGHKLHAPKGVGAMFVRDKRMLHPLVNGSGKQEFGLRAGTENVASIVGFGKACELEMENHKQFSERRLKCAVTFYNVLRCAAQEYGVLKNISKNGYFASRVQSYTISGIDAQTLILMCDAREVCISAGSACNDNSSNPSHVLTGIGLTDDQARSTIRVSFSRMNTPEECVKAAKIIADSVRFLLNQRGG